ncbi:hypothetical protein R1flu_021608 [Riccia fluitans]|uniref:rRNA-processing protein EBP2 n=1 Tax=Riccia fluitans TaxID=41844 RepID=A0ABD1ZRI1_9MARC
MADLEESDYSGSESEEEEESSSEEEHERPLKEPRKDAVYDTNGMHEKLEDIGWPDDLDWIQTCVITSPKSENQVDVNDDLVREMAFYTQALEGAKEAYLKLQELGIPFLRPSDYYAEMIKTDSHMLKIKDKLLHEKSKLEETDERRKAREAKKYSKEVQAEKLKERAKRKKQDIESVKKWRKVRQKSGHEGDDVAPPIDFEDRSGKSNGARRGRGGHGRGDRPSMNRESRDAKYGNGGRKHGSKRNDANSSADDSSFRGKGRGRGRGGGRGRGKRPRMRRM